MLKYASTENMQTSQVSSQGFECSSLLEIETSLIEDNNRSSIAKVQITLKRNDGVKELLDRIAKERDAENL